MDSPVNSIAPATTTVTKAKKKPIDLGPTPVNPYPQKIAAQQKAEKHASNVAGAKKTLGAVGKALTPGPIKSAIGAVKNLKDSLKGYYDKAAKSPKVSDAVKNLQTKSAEHDKYIAMYQMGLNGDRDAARAYKRWKSKQGE